MTEKPLSPSQIQSSIRHSIIQRLPGAIETGMTSYMRFIDGGLVRQPKSSIRQTIPSIEYDRLEFKAHHDACKVALAHINLLLDLARDLLADQSDEDNLAAVALLSESVQKAMAEINAAAPASSS